MKTQTGETLSRILIKPPETVARLLSNEFALGGPSVGLRVLSVYIAYGGRQLSASRRQSLERARKLLLKRSQQAMRDER